MGIGMKISKKYHGAAMPNRTKIGIAGCRNACGGVYSKDFGIIADVTGFRVTVGGSSGFHPRVADIIGIDLPQDEAYSLFEKAITYYQLNANFGEKASDFILRIGLDKFKEGTTKQDSDDFDYNKKFSLT